MRKLEEFQEIELKRLKLMVKKKVFVQGDINTIIHQYKSLGYSMNEIAKNLGVNPKTIKKFLIEYNIPIRTTIFKRTLDKLRNDVK